MSRVTRIQRIERWRPELTEARRFLKLLKLDDEAECFQTFDDDRDRKSAKLARILHGQLRDHEAELERLNQLGAGIFVAVNVTDSRGRSRENIRAVRALSLDLDGAPPEPARECALRPHIEVESSPGRYHFYWLVEDDFPLDKYEDVQRGLAKRFDGDPSVALLTHVARLPGFDHCKGDRFRTRIVKINDSDEYPADDIIKEFPPEKRPHKAPASRVVLLPEAPMKSAKQFVQDVYMPKGAEPPAYGLYYFRGHFYPWDGVQYRQVSDGAVRSKLYKYLEDALAWSATSGYVPFNPNPSKVNAILDALRAGVMLPDDATPPFWIGKEPVHDDTLLACQNGLVNVETGELRHHDPLYFNTNALAFDYDPDAPQPDRWLTLLEQLWPEDKQSRRTLQEILGLLLTSDTSFQKIFMMVGPRRAGKGTIAKIFTALLGRDNVAYPNLASLNTNFGAAPLIDKKVAVVSDARISKDASTVAERLLAISGEDGQQIDVKYKPHWMGRLTVRFLLLSNELPRIADASGALASRFVLLVLKNSFYGKEDHALYDKLLPELPGILNWGLAGLARLRKRGYFEMPDSSKEAIRTLEDLTSPTAAFIREWCVVGPTERVRVKLLFDAWSKWCGVNGHKAGSAALFGRNLVAAEARITPRGRGSDRFYGGVALTEDGEKQYENARRELA